MTDFFKLVMYKFGAALGTLLFTLLVVFYYSDEVTETVFSVILILYLLSIASRNGLELLIVKEYHSLIPIDRPFWLGNMIKIIFVLSSFYGLVYYFVDIFLLGNGYALWVLVNLFPFSSLLIFSYYFRARELKLLSALVEHGSLFLIVSALILIIQAIGGQVVNPIVILTFTNWLFFLLIFLSLLKFNFAQFGYASYYEIKKMLISGSPFMLLAIASYMTLWIPAFVIKIESPKAFIDYNLAVRFLAPVTFIITTVDFYLSSHFSRAKVVGDIRRVNNLFTKFRRFFLLAGLGYIALTAILLFYAASYFDEITKQIILFYGVILTGYFASCLIGPCGILLNMYGFVRYANYATVISALLIIAGVTPVFSYFGAQGVVAFVAISIVLRNLIMFVFLKYYQILD